MNFHVSSSLEPFIKDNYSTEDLTEQTLSALREAFAHMGISRRRPCGSASAP